MNTGNDAPVAPPTASGKYAHLYMPLITTLLISINGPVNKHFSDPNRDDSADMMLLVAASAIPTYYIASQIYPANRPDPTFEERVRFSREHEANRALVLATYGRWFGTPFNLQFLFMDFICSYGIGALIGERPVGARQRKSEFLIALLWVAGSAVFQMLIPPGMPMLTFLAVAFDRTVYRAAYVALVDDIIGVLARPNIRSLRGKITLVLVQAFTITSLVYFALSTLAAWKMRNRAAKEI
jgi:hypothetical protein